ncbi:hypothetical protein [Scytonema sp. HK-05]|nr:hypothetical protein [Scytonema sp. HK-05]
MVAPEANLKTGLPRFHVFRQGELLTLLSRHAEDSCFNRPD